MRVKIFTIILMLLFWVVPVQATTNLRQINPATPTPTPTIPTNRVIIIESTPTPIPSQTRVLRRLPTFTATPARQATPILKVITPTSQPTLTPTPIPSARNTFELKKTGNEIYLDGQKLERSTPVEITLASSSAILITEKDVTKLSFTVNEQKVDLPIRADFLVKDGRLSLVSEGKELSLKLAPNSFYFALKSVLKKSLSELQTVDLRVDKGKPYYFVKIKSRLKLLGFIPFSAEGLLRINATTNTSDAIDYSRLVKLVAATPNFNQLFTDGPDLEFINVTFEPLSFKEGNQMVIRAELHNQGTEKAYAMNGSHVKNWLYYKDQPIYGTDEAVIDLEPGQSRILTYVWDKVVCGAPLSIIFDSDRILKEQNSQTTWYGTASCAPDYGPDLTVTQMIFEGTYYGGKNPGTSNKVSYTIKNIGGKASEPVTALAKAGNAQFLSLISVPVINPSGNYSGSFNFTPTTCDPVDIKVDTQGILKSTETNRDNNDIFEDKQVTDWCNNYPQLQFDWVYWKVNGYSFGKSKYPNGSVMNFQINVGNLSWNDGVGCAFTKIRADINGQFATEVMVGKVGNCTNGGVHDTGDNAHMYKTVNFTLGPACGSQIKFTLDPDNFNPEINRSDNTWTHTVECE